MKFIAHRGNTNGPQADYENNPLYVKNALSRGFDVEIDVWYEKNNFYLGHDSPKFLLLEESLLVDDHVWCHAKSLEALEKLLANKSSNCFWHQTDDYTLTSKGFIWTYPEKRLTKNSICVTNEKILTKESYKKIEDISFGICSDYVSILESYK